MNKLAPRAEIVTPAGSIWLPDWLCPFHPPEEHEKRSLFKHMQTVGLPPSAWNEWRRDIGCERVSEIKSLIHLFTIWLRVCKWQKSCKVEGVPECTWGAEIHRQVMSPNYATKKALTGPIDALS